MKSLAICAGLVVFGLSFGQEPPLQLGIPVTVGTTVVVPILSASQDNPTEYTTLVEAAKAGTVVVREGFFGSVVVTNNSKLPLLLEAGDTLIGGHQDQTIRNDVTLVPGQTTSVAVYCIEPGRSTGGIAFNVGDYMVPDWMRKIEAKGSGPSAQMGIWTEVGKINRAQGLNPPTGALRATFESEYFMNGVETTSTKLKSVDDSEAVVGMMIILNGRILSGDLYGSHKIFDHARPNLLNLYSIESNLVAAGSHASPASAEQCQAFLNEIAGAPRFVSTRNSVNDWFRVASRAIVGVEIGIAGANGRQGFIHGSYFPQG